MEKLIFRKVLAEDRSYVESFFHGISSQQQNHCFPVLYLYRDSYHARIADCEGFLIMQMEYLGRTCYFFPVGMGNPFRAIKALIQTAEDSGKGCTLIKLTVRQKEYLEKHFPGCFAFETERGDHEYLYSTEKLQQLKGRAFQAKRNHIHAFEKQKHWVYERISSENLEECKSFSLVCACHSATSLSGVLTDSAQYDAIALSHALEEYLTLELLGGLIRVDGSVSAFALGCPVGKDTLVVLFERADSFVRGLYPLLFREFCRNAGAGFLYTNRGEDLNHQGLRQSKLSWKPDYLLELFDGKYLGPQPKKNA